MHLAVFAMVVWEVGGTRHGRMRKHQEWRKNSARNGSKNLGSGHRVVSHVAYQEDGMGKGSVHCEDCTNDGLKQLVPRVMHLAQEALHIRPTLELVVWRKLGPEKSDVSTRNAAPAKMGTRALTILRRAADFKPVCNFSGRVGHHSDHHSPVGNHVK